MSFLPLSRKTDSILSFSGKGGEATTDSNGFAAAKRERERKRELEKNYRSGGKKKDKKKTTHTKGDYDSKE